jgi:hypothetical protein
MVQLDYLNDDIVYVKLNNQLGPYFKSVACYKRDKQKTNIEQIDHIGHKDFNVKKIFPTKRGKNHEHQQAKFHENIYTTLWVINESINPSQGLQDVFIDGDNYMCLVQLIRS